MKQAIKVLIALAVFVSFAVGDHALAVNKSKVTQKNPNASTTRAPVAGVRAATPTNRGSKVDSRRAWNPNGVDRQGQPGSRWNDPQPTTSVAPASAGSRVSPNYLPPDQSQNISQPRWRLGFYPKEAEVGIGIGQVISGSAAERGGLEVGDLIVSVAGHQVGYVDGVYFDCSAEFEHHVAEDGWVTLLVQDHRSGRLVNLPIQLDGRQSKLQGSITYRERYALPHDAVVTVELREILRPGAPPVTLARETMRASRHVPIPFSINYDPSQIDRRRTYSLHAKIASGNRVLFITRRNIPVFSGGSNKNVELLVESATAFPTGGQRPQSTTTQIDQISQWFREYLHRSPRASELYVWKAHLERGGSLYDAQSQLLSTPEFYYQSNANDREYITRMHELIVGQRPNQQQVDFWLNRMSHHKNLRSEVVREFLAERRTRR